MITFTIRLISYLNDPISKGPSIRELLQTTFLIRPFKQRMRIKVDPVFKEGKLSLPHKHQLDSTLQIHMIRATYSRWVIFEELENLFDDVQFQVWIFGAVKTTTLQVCDQNC